MNEKTKFIVVTGGSMSGIGKGVTVSSLGVVLKCKGIRVTVIKIDPYLNVDAGTMSPFEHGEVFVLDDGGEVDLDLGNYERFLDITLTSNHNITTGKVYKEVIRKEREGQYLGKTVQVVPHVTNEILDWITNLSQISVDDDVNPPEVCLIELGGTVGDIESSIYLESLRQLAFRHGRENFCLCHLCYLPQIGIINEQKTKPAQHSLKELRQAGLIPDFLFCRSESFISVLSRSKLQMISELSPECIISLHSVTNMYRVPLIMEEQNVANLLCERLKLIPRVNLVETSPTLLPQKKSHNTLKNWLILADSFDANNDVCVKIGIVGKYTGMQDSYLSVVKALHHACMEIGCKLKIFWIESSDLEKKMDDSGIENPNKGYKGSWEKLNLIDGIVCPGGFGDRGIKGKSLSANYCRLNNKPYLGICLGMQTAIIEFAQNVAKIGNAASEEFDTNSTDKVIISMPEHNSIIKGSTMRLGSKKTQFRSFDCLSYKLYDKQPIIEERHRHRYEVNPDYVDIFEKNGMKFVGTDLSGQRMEIAELENHPFFICCQFHPEFSSRPMHTHPLFLGLVLASTNKLEERLKKNNGYLYPGGIYE